MSGFMSSLAKKHITKAKTLKKEPLPQKSKQQLEEFTRLGAFVVSNPAFQEVMESEYGHCFDALNSALQQRDYELASDISLRMGVLEDVYATFDAMKDATEEKPNHAQPDATDYGDEVDDNY